MFMVANYFLWTYPKNANTLASRFKMCVNFSKGEHLGIWVKRITALKASKIKWDPKFDEPNSGVYIMTVDGTDFRCWERKTATLNIDKSFCSVKFKHAALKYLVGVSVHEPKCVWIYGPSRGGEHDMTMMQKSGILKKVKKGKLVIVDRGFIKKKEKDKLSWPNPMDSKEVNNFKSRARLRHETFNGRLKEFGILYETFRHDYGLHQFAFEAVVVIVQYQMDNGSPIFSV